MTRPLRLQFPGAVWHATNRGVGRRDIFLDDGDRRLFLDLIGEVAERYRWRVHTYTLMSNHYHLTFQTVEPTLSRGMQKLNGDFAAHFNRRRDRVGHLFQARFHAQLIDSDSYLLEVARYVVLNPVRAGMVDAPADWPWSSYRATAGLEPGPSWLDDAPLLDRLDPNDRSRARELYRQFVAAGIGRSPSPWENLVAGLYLGGSDFIAKVEELARSRTWKDENSKQQQRVRARSLAHVAEAVEHLLATPLHPRTWRNDRARRVLALVAHEESIASLSEIGAYLGLTVSGVHHLMTRTRHQLETDQELRAILDRLRVTLRQPLTPF